MNRRKFLSVAFAAVPLACGRKRSSGFSGYAYVANENINTVAVVDLSSFNVKQRLRLDEPATQILSHANQPRVYALAPKSGIVYEIDSEKMAVTRKKQVSRSASSMQLAHDGSAIWVLDTGDHKLVRLQLASFQVDSRIDVAPDPAGFDLAPFFDRAVISHREEGAFALVNLQSGKAMPQIRLSERIGAVRFLSDGKSLVVANTADRALTAIEASSGRIITHLQLAVRPDHLCFKNDGGQLFITGEGRDAVVVVYPYFVPQIAETVLAGSTPGAMAAAERFLFVSNPRAGGVSILNIARRKVVAAVSVGAEPGYIAITPDDQYALVLNQSSGDMAVIRMAAVVTATEVPDRLKSVGLFTMIPVGSRPVSAAVKGVA